MKRSCHPNLTDGKFAKSNPFHFKTTHKRLIFNYFKELLIRFNGTAMSLHNYIMEEEGTIIYEFDDSNGQAIGEFKFMLVNNEIRLLRNVDFDGIGPLGNKLEVYSTGGNYSADEFHFVANSVAYPNPARSNITLPYELEDGETTTMSIYNLNGQLIERFNIGSHFNQVQLNVSGYSPGIYLYEYKGRSNKFIVQ